VERAVLSRDNKISNLKRKQIVEKKDSADKLRKSRKTITKEQNKRRDAVGRTEVEQGKRLKAEKSVSPPFIVLIHDVN
jgi:hypothetical protein